MPINFDHTPAGTITLTVPSSGTGTATLPSFTGVLANTVPRVTTSTANTATPAINTDTTDTFIITGQSTAITSFTTNLTGTPSNGQKLWISITGTTETSSSCSKGRTQ